MKIVPSLLSEKFEDFLLRLRQAESFVDYVQVDLMDGIFVPTESFPAERINSVNTSLSFEIHLMVKDPSLFVNVIKNPGLKKVIFHFESDVNHHALIDIIRARGLDAGIAINPETRVEEFSDVAKKAGTLLFLTVDPGRYGSSFKPEVLKKIEKARNIFPDKLIAADGGVSLDNLKTFSELGVDCVCVGSRIFSYGNPEENYRLFVKKANPKNASSRDRDD